MAAPHSKSTFTKKTYYRNNAMAERKDTIGPAEREGKRAREKEFGKLAHANTSRSTQIHKVFIEFNQICYHTHMVHALHGCQCLSTRARSQHIASHRGKKPIKYKHDWRALAQLKYSQITHELKIQFLKSLSRAHSTCISDCCSIFHITNNAQTHTQTENVPTQWRRLHCICDNTNRDK